ncbi:MAG TPA: pyrimidine 5'-nucleotidase [Anaerolineaceae bacterium]|nr:pyrimidine 5'-nucleotidase [Anaerolineaceae bacterium]
MKISTLLIDLDDTVYPPTVEVWPLVMKRMFLYMRDFLGIPEDEIPAMRDRLFNRYGTTLRGLQIERGINAKAYLDYVHDVDLSALLSPDPALRSALDRIALPKLIFTNACESHARNVLRLMDLESCFEGIIDVVAVQPYCKPEPEAYHIALELAGSPDPREVLMVDDRLENVAAASSLGMHTVLVSLLPQDGFRTIPRLALLPDLLGA